MNIENSVLRKVDDLFRQVDYLITKKPAKWLAEKKVRANWVTADSILFGIAGEVMVSRNTDIASSIEENTGLRVSPKFIKWLGVFFVVKSFYEDILDGKVADEQEGGPTEDGGNFDHAGDRSVDSSFDTLEMTNPEDACRQVAAEVNQNFVARPSELRAIAKKHHIWVPEIDPGSRFLRFFSFMGALISEEHRTRFININTAQSVTSVAIRYGLIWRSGNQEAIAEANNALLTGSAIYGVTRIDRPTSLWRNVLSQAVAIVPSIRAKIDSNGKK